MNRLRIGLLIVVGCSMLLLGMTLLMLDSAYLYAQDDEPLEYVGARECNSCHRDTARIHSDTAHALALQESDEDVILADFEQAEDLRTVQFPGDDAPRAFTADDIALVIGAGRYTQAYVFEVERDVYQVFPAQWNVTINQWEALSLAETWPAPAYDFMQQCAGCHVTGLNVAEGEWEDIGVQCEACHGPASLHVELADDAGRRPSDEELAAVRASINPSIDPQVCGACHSRGAVAEGTPAFPAAYRPGDALQQDGVYTLFSPEDPNHWYSTGHASAPNMQYNEWLASRHGSALLTLREGEAVDESCLSCHSQDAVYTLRVIEAFAAGDKDGVPPQPLTAETAQYGVTCASCHNPHVENDLPAQLTQEAYLQCVGCHSNSSFEAGTIHHPVQEMYEGTAIIEGIEAVPGVHFTDPDGPDCLTCHMPRVPVEGVSRASHTMQPVMPGAALDEAGLIDACSECHQEQATPALMQRLIDDIQADTRARIDAARQMTVMPDWVTQALDFVEQDGSLGIHNYAYMDTLLDAVEAELGLFPAVGQ